MRLPYKVGTEVIYIQYDQAALVEQQAVFERITLGFSYYKLPKFGEGAVVPIKATESFYKQEGGIQYYNAQFGFYTLVQLFRLQESLTSQRLAYRFLRVDVLFPARQRIRSVITRASSISDLKVKTREKFSLACLSAIKLLYRYKVLQGLVVRKDFNALGATIQFRSLVAE